MHPKDAITSKTLEQKNSVSAILYWQLLEPMGSAD